VTARIAPRGSGPNAGTDFPLVVVNPYRTEGADLRGAPLVARVNNLTFEYGLLTGLAVTQPSTIVAVASVPYNVIRGFLSAFGEILTLRVNNYNSEASLVAAQTTLINNMRSNIEAEQSLRMAREAAAR
jgi:hypothetical protein